MDELTGRIGLVRGGTAFWDNAIVEATHSPYHHTVVALDNNTCMSAEPGGALIRPNVGTFPHVDWLDPIATPDEAQAIAWHARQLEHTRYNRVSFVLAGLAAIGLPIPQTLANIALPFGMDCVMLVCAAYKAAGITLLADPITGAPGDLAKLHAKRTPQAV